jgi:phage terminase large subunit GpA-like protein
LNAQTSIFPVEPPHEYETHTSALQYFKGVVLPRVWGKLRPPVRMLVSEWADKNRTITYGAKPMKWDSKFVPYTIEPMNAPLNSETERISVVKCNQSGGSEFSLSVVGFYIVHKPTDIILFQPTDKLSKSFANDKVNTLIADTPSLSSIVGEVKTRDASNKTLEKRFHGKHLFIAGANSRASFRQIWGELIIKDDLDMFPPYLKGEGDPGKLADARAETFTHTKKIINISTPTDDGTSRIQQEFEASSQAHWHIKCPKCGYEQVMLFSDRSVFNYLPHGRLVYDKESGTEPKWAYYECGNEKCKFEIQEWMKTELVQNGRYIHRYPERLKHRGYQWNRLISPFSTWQKIASEFLAAQADKDQLKVFVNLALGEWFHTMKMQSIDPTGLTARVEEDLNARVYEPVPESKRSVRVNHKYAVPMNGIIVVVSVDVQDDRLEAKVKAWGLDEESFLIKRVILRGTPSRSEVWSRLDELIDEEFYHQSGIYLKPRAVTIDIGGHFTNQVYAWIRRKRDSGRNVYGIQGRANTSTVRLIVDKVSTHNRYRVPVIVCGVDTAKEIVRRRLVDYDQTKAQMHFCDDVGHESQEALIDYFKGLVSEEQATILDRRTGRVRYEWHIRKGYKRNEPSDLENYNLAGLLVMGLNMKLEHKKLQERIMLHNQNPDEPMQQRKTKQERKARPSYDPKNWK